MFEWYNNGKKNIKISNQIIPEGYIKGFIIIKDKIKRIKKLNERFERNLKRRKAYYDSKYERDKERLEQRLLFEQKQIIDF